LISECQILQREKASQQAQSVANVAECSKTTHRDFCIQGTVSANGVTRNVQILRDTAADRSVIVEGIVPLDSQTQIGTGIISGMECRQVSVPLHQVDLKCGIGDGPVVVAVRPQLLFPMSRCYWGMI